MGQSLCYHYVWSVKAELEAYTKKELIALIEAKENDTSSLDKENRFLKDEIVYLKFKMSNLLRELYGQKRERFENRDNNQLPLPFEPQSEDQQKIDEQATQKITYHRKKRRKDHPGRMPLPDHLPVEEIVIEPEADVTDMVRIGEEVTEELEYTPARFYIKRYIRPKYAPKNKEGVFIGSLPARPIDKGIAGAGLLASILVDKYVDHLPIYRQMERFKRENIPLARSTLDGWVRQSLELLDILYEKLKKETTLKGYIQADESTIKVRDSNKKGKCHLGYYWVYHDPIDKTVLFDYQPGRSIKAANGVLEDFKGYLQTDGYAGYESFGNKEEVTHLFCWAHARREFEKALDNDKDRASKALLYIQQLYKVEAQAREQEMSAEQRKKLRLDKSLPILKDFGKWMEQALLSGGLLPKSPIGKAVNYSLKRWGGLNAYLYDGILEIDNNLVENAIRPLALGRKNYLFAGSHKAAQRAASAYSFFAICKKHEVNPYNWLKYVLENILDTKASKLDKFYPQNFKEESNM